MSIIKARLCYRDEMANDLYTKALAEFDRQWVRLQYEGTTSPFDVRVYACVRGLRARVTSIYVNKGCFR